MFLKLTANANSASISFNLNSLTHFKSTITNILSNSSLTPVKQMLHTVLDYKVVPSKLACYSNKLTRTRFILN
jgi:hypothetical protein